MRTRLLTLALLASVAFLPASARADGLPVEGVDASRSGVTGLGELTRYVTLPAGRKTVVASVSVDGGKVHRSRLLPGTFTIPVVAYDGSAGGLSADGRTLVLIEPRRAFPRRETSFAVLGTTRLKLREVVSLRGDYSFDAVSPDGRWLYLVEYLSSRDPSRYLVRLYDLKTNRLRREPIIDPREVGDVMRGMPVTRAYSPDGRFAYTLYDGAGEHPFIHALDTVEKSARCIDLHGLMGFQRFQELKLDVSPDGGSIAVTLGSEPVALVDTQTDEVTEPLPAAPKTSTPAVDEDPRSVPWLLIGGVAAALLALLFLAQRLLQRRRRSETQKLEAELSDLLREDAEREPERPRVPVR
jgi:hypothetical protein